MTSAWQVHAAKSQSWHSVEALQNLRLVADLPKPTTIPATSVLIRIRTVALNPRDLMVIAHDPVYPATHIDNLIPCTDNAGEIEAVGENSIWRVGERVFIHPNRWVEGTAGLDAANLKALGGGDNQGTLRRYAVFPDDQIIRAPKHLSFEEIATLPTAGGTAMNALLSGPKIGPGVTIVTQGTGGVSNFAIQIASALGATVIATSSSSEKLEIAKSLGASHLINYTTSPNWAEEVLRITNGKGVDHVIDVAGSGTIQQSLQSVKHGGLVSVLGILTPSTKSDIVPALLFGGKTVRGHFGFSKHATETLVRIVEEHNIHPLIAKTFEWEEVPKAVEALINQTAVGKIVIRV